MTNPPQVIRNPQSSILRMKLADTNYSPQAAELDELPGKSNYFIGNDPKRWRTDIPTYAKVKYEAVYPGVDVVYYGTQGRQLEYDFVIIPQDDPKAIKLSFEGADQLEMDKRGDLALRLNGKELRMHKPVVYQEKDGARQDVSSGYKLAGEHEVGFEIASYDASRLLVIDLVLVYSTYLGGSGQDIGLGIAVNAHGCAFVTGLTTSPDFPADPIKAKFGPDGSVDAFVSKFNAAGTQLVYSTYLGGGNDENLYSTFDIYKCYEALAQDYFQPFSVKLTDQFEEQQVLVMRPTTLCNPVVKCVNSNTPSIHPTGQDCTPVLNPDDHWFATKPKMM